MEFLTNFDFWQRIYSLICFGLSMSLREKLSVPRLSSKKEHDEYLDAVFRREVRFPFGVAGMGVGYSNANLVTAAMEERMMGTLAATAIGYNDNREAILAEKSFDKRVALYKEANARVLLEQIRAVRERMPHGILAVNVLAAASDFRELIDVMGKSKEVDIAFVGAGLPRELAKQMEQYPAMRYMPIVSSNRAASIMLRSASDTTRPPDAFYMEDPTKAGGHLGAKDVADALNKEKFDFRLLCEQIRAVIPEKTPLIAGGGMGHRGRMNTALDIGYDGVIAGTPFLLTQESGLPDHIIEKYFLDSRYGVATVQTSPAGLPSRIIQAPKNPEDFRSEIRARCVSCIGHERCGFFNADFKEEEMKPLDERKYCIAHRLPMTQRGEEGGTLFTGELEPWRKKLKLLRKDDKPYIPTVKEITELIFREREAT